MSKSAAVLVLAAVVAVSALGLLLYGPVAQPAVYHNFADGRSLWGIPNFLNVVSNAAFALVGVLGIASLSSRRLPSGLLPGLRPAWFCFFLGAILTGAGSAFYHIAPRDGTLAWDRLPMTLVFMSLLCIVLGEQVSERWAARFLLPLLVLGGLSVYYWRASAGLGREDLRPYILVQYLPIVLIPLALLLLTPRLKPRWPLWAGLGVYLVAKVFEAQDTRIFGLGGVISGHSLKHAAGALSLGCFLWALRKRGPVPGVGSGVTSLGGVPRNMARSESAAVGGALSS